MPAPRELCYVPFDLVTSMPVSVKRLCIRGSSMALGKVRDIGRLVNLRTLELDAPRPASPGALAEFRMHLEAAIPEGCELIIQ